MKQKTAMMELIEAIDELIKDDYGKYIDTDIFLIRNKAQQLLEKEKEQMVLFSVKMSQKDGSNTGIDLLEDEAIAYYNQTYLEEKI